MGILDRFRGAWQSLTGRVPVRLAEATEEELYGTPVDMSALYTFRGFPLIPVWGPEQRPEKNQTIRTIAELDRARNLSRIVAEKNPNAAGLIERLQDYVVGRGSSTEVHSAVEDEEPPVRLSAKVGTFCNRFRKLNRWRHREREMVHRLVVDGEFFLRFWPQEDGVTLTRFVEPSRVRPPATESADGPWAWGVYTSAPYFDAESPEAYNFHDWRTGANEIVPAEFVIHGKLNCLSTAKRGIPSFHACSDELIGSTKLRYAVREGEKNRQSIAYFRVHDSATEQDVRAWQDRSATRTVNRDVEPGFAPQTINVQQIEPGQVVDVSAGFKPEAPPVSNTTPAEGSVMMALEAVAARMGLPIWMVSGRNSDANFAAALTTESPAVKAFESWQANVAEYVDDAQTKALEIAAEQDEMPEDVLERIDLLVSFTSPVVRNKAEETGRRKILHEANVLSETTWMTEEGLDPKKEKQQMLEERADPIPPLPTKVPSLPVDPSTGQTARPQQVPSSTPAARYKQLAVREQEDGRGDGGADPDEIDPEVLADLFYGIYGDDALPILKRLGGLVEAWEAAAHPRGKGGRFIPKGSAEAVSAAQDAVSRALAGEDVDPKQVLDHLSILTVKQITELAKKHGKTAPGLLRAQLVDAVQQVVGQKRGEKAAAKMLDTAEVAKHAQVAPRTVSKWVDSGQLPGERHPTTGNRTVSEADLAAFFIKHEMPIPEGLKGVTPTPPDEFEKKRAASVRPVEPPAAGAGGKSVGQPEAGRPLREPVGLDRAEVGKPPAGGDAGPTAGRGSDAAADAGGGAHLTPLEDYLDEEYQKLPADFRKRARAAAAKGERHPDALRAEDAIRGRHRAAVQTALAAGKPVPPEVLADYPDLKPPAKEDDTSGKLDLGAGNAAPEPAAKPPADQAGVEALHAEIERLTGGGRVADPLTTPEEVAEVEAKLDGLGAADLTKLWHALGGRSKPSGRADALAKVKGQISGQFAAYRRGLQGGPQAELYQVRQEAARAARRGAAAPDEAAVERVMAGLDGPEAGDFRRHFGIDRKLSHQKAMALVREKLRAEARAAFDAKRAAASSGPAPDDGGTLDLGAPDETPAPEPAAPDRSTPGSPYEAPARETIPLSHLAKHVGKLIADDDEASPPLDPADVQEPPLIKRPKGKSHEALVVDGAHRLAGMLRWAKENSIDPRDVPIKVVTVDDPKLMNRLAADNDDADDFAAATLDAHDRADGGRTLAALRAEIASDYPEDEAANRGKTVADLAAEYNLADFARRTMRRAAREAAPKPKPAAPKPAPAPKPAAPADPIDAISQAYDRARGSEGQSAARKQAAAIIDSLSGAERQRVLDHFRLPDDVTTAQPGLLDDRVAMAAIEGRPKPAAPAPAAAAPEPKAPAAPNHVAAAKARVDAAVAAAHDLAAKREAARPADATPARARQYDAETQRQVGDATRKQQQQIAAELSADLEGASRQELHALAKRLAIPPAKLRGADDALVREMIVREVVHERIGNFVRSMV